MNHMIDVLIAEFASRYELEGVIRIEQVLAANVQEDDVGHVEREYDKAERADDDVEELALAAARVGVACGVRRDDQDEPVDVGEHDYPGRELRQDVDGRGEELARERRVRRQVHVLDRVQVELERPYAQC